MSRFDHYSYGTGSVTSKWIRPTCDEEAEFDDVESASDRHTFSIVPVGIAISFTIVLVYAILVIQHYRSDNSRNQLNWLS